MAADPTAARDPFCAARSAAAPLPAAKHMDFYVLVTS
jgi:hypothetical protein